MKLNHLQAQTLIEVLQENIDGEEVLVVKQSDGTVVVAFSMSSIAIDKSGNAEEN